MPEPTVQEKTAVNLREQWRDRITEHARSGLSIKQFCKDRGIAEHVFYYWRKRLRPTEPVRFALIDRAGAACAPEWNLEVLLVNGDRLRIGASVDAATLRMVLEALRA
jgi:transposase-like protein